MPLLYAIELVVTGLLLVLIITQVGVPAYSGGKFFPLFRRNDLEKTRREAEEALARIEEEAKIASIREYAKHVQEHAHHSDAAAEVNVDQGEVKEHG